MYFKPARARKYTPGEVLYQAARNELNLKCFKFRCGYQRDEIV